MTAGKREVDENGRVLLSPDEAAALTRALRWGDETERRRALAVMDQPAVDRSES